jgi:hypothetical protein
VEALFARAPAPCRGEEHPKVKQRQAHSAQLRQGLVGPVHFIMYIVEDNKKNTSQNWKTTASILLKKNLENNYCIYPVQKRLQF